MTTEPMDSEWLSDCRDEANLQLPDHKIAHVTFGDLRALLARLDAAEAERDRLRETVRRISETVNPTIGRLPDMIREIIARAALKGDRPHD